MTMLLAIDVGNTNIVLGVFERDRLAQSWRLATYRERTADELGMMVTNLFRHAGLDPAAIAGVILASVVPPLTGMIREMTVRYFGQEPVTVDGTTATGMVVRYDPPSDVGADRLVNGVAAFELYGRPRRAATVVVDFGTATTFDVVDARGDYCGGVIAPGINLSLEALNLAAAKLPRIAVKRPASVIGKSTVPAMQSGVYWGYISLIEGVVRRIAEEFGSKMTVVATGGLAPLFAEAVDAIEHLDPDLTLRGLVEIHRRNKRP
jgi:type III pantothenate kinase